MGLHRRHRTQLVRPQERRRRFMMIGLGGSLALTGNKT
jgi:hypothetical protein